MKRFANKCALRSFADEINITVVPIGGFTQRDKIANAAWTFEKVLRANISIAALLDRDYRCDEEINELIQTIRQSVPNFFVLGSKEIENYLLNPAAMTKAACERARDRGINGPDEGYVRSILEKCTDEIKSDVSGQIIANRMNFFSRSAKDPATVASEATKLLDAHWTDLNLRLRIVPGKQILSSFNAQLQKQLKISITNVQIIRHMRQEDIELDLVDILRRLDSFATNQA